MNKKDNTDKMDSLVNDKQTYEPLKRDPTPALQRRVNGKLLDLRKTETIDTQLYYRLRCRIPQSAKLYGLPKLHKANIPRRPKVLFWRVTIRGTSGDCGTSGSYKVCYLVQLWYSSEIVVRRPSTGTSQVRRLVRPSLTIPVTLLGTYAGHPALTQGKPSFFYPLLLKPFFRSSSWFVY